MKPVLISFGFDDGCLSTYVNAFPILKENGLVGCVSVVTDFVGRENKYTWGHIREMTDCGWEVVGHTKTHDMWDLTPEKLQIELVGSKEILTGRGFLPKVFITPGGPWQEQQPHQFADGSPLEQIIRKHYAGFIHGATHPVRCPVDPYRIGRYGCECYDLDQFNRTIEEIRGEIDRTVAGYDWCHLGWHNVEGRHIATFRGVVEHVRRYVDEGRMKSTTVSQAAGIG